MSDFQTSPDAGAPEGEASNPAAAQPNAATTDPQTDGGEGGEKSQAAPPKTFTQDEVNDLIKREKARTEAKTERRVLRTIERILPAQTGAQPQSTQAPAADGKPLRSQYASEDEWLDARDAWRDKQRESERRTTEIGSKTEQVWAQVQKMPGFDAESFAEMADAGQITKPMLEAVLELDEPAKVLHFLTSNPTEAERIAKLSGPRQAAELGKLEAKAAAAPQAKPSKAPDPIESTGGSRTPVHDLASASMDSYIEQRRKQGAAWAR